MAFPPLAVLLLSATAATSAAPYDLPIEPAAVYVWSDARLDAYARLPEPLPLVAVEAIVLPAADAPAPVASPETSARRPVEAEIAVSIAVRTLR